MCKNWCLARAPSGTAKIEICHYLKCLVKCNSECFVAFSLQMWLFCRPTCHRGLGYSEGGYMLLLRGPAPVSHLSLHLTNQNSIIGDSKEPSFKQYMKILTWRLMHIYFIFTQNNNKTKINSEEIVFLSQGCTILQILLPYHFSNIKYGGGASCAHGYWTECR